MLMLAAGVFSDAMTVQIVLSTAHPAKFSEAVTRALEGAAGFNFENDVLPVEFKGLLEKERRVIDIEAPRVELVQQVIERFVSSAVTATQAPSV
jgi:threonine synthase